MPLRICHMAGLVHGKFRIKFLSSNLVPFQWYAYLVLWYVANVFSSVHFSVAVCLRKLDHHILLAHGPNPASGTMQPQPQTPYV